MCNFIDNLYSWFRDNNYDAHKVGYSSIILYVGETTYRRFETFGGNDIAKSHAIEIMFHVDRDVLYVSWTKKIVRNWNIPNYEHVWTETVLYPLDMGYDVFINQRVVEENRRWCGSGI